MAQSFSQQLELPSNRSFGRLFVIVFGLLALGAWWRGSGWLLAWLGLSGVTLLVTLLTPDVLTPLNRLWMRFATLLHRIVSPIMLGLIFFALITPFGFVMRVRGRDPMARRFDAASRSYWIERKPPGPDPQSLQNQF